jgi:hypothetical protein
MTNPTFPYWEHSLFTSCWCAGHRHQYIYKGNIAIIRDDQSNSMLINISKTAFYHSVYHPRAFTSLQMCFCLIINHYILSQLYTVCFFKSNFQCMKINSLPLSKIICIVSIVIHIIFKPKIVSTIITLYIDLGIKNTLCVIVHTPLSFSSNVHIPIKNYLQFATM